MLLLHQTRGSTFWPGKLLLIFLITNATQRLGPTRVIACQSLNGASGNVLSRFWTNAVYPFVGGGTGSFSLLLTLLCIKLQDANPMSVRRHKPYISFKPASNKRLKDAFFPKRNRRRNYKSKKNKNITTKNYSAAGDDKELRRSAYASSGISDADDVGEGNSGNSALLPLLALYENLLKLDKDAYFDLLAPSGKKGDRRKSDRLGTPSDSIRNHKGAGRMAIGGLRNVFMTPTDEEALRLKILAKVEELDPLMCLPKALCGYSNRRGRRKKHSKPTTTSTSHTHNIPGDSLINDYLQLLKIVGPSKKKKVAAKEKDMEDDIKYQKAKYTTQSKKVVSKKEAMKKKAKRKKRPETEEDDVRVSSSSESDESDDSPEYERYPIPKYERYPTNKKPRKLGSTFRNKYKTIFDKKRGDKDDSIENDDFQKDIDNIFDDEHMKYLLERAKIEKLMSTTGSYSDENWWTPFEPDPTPENFAYGPFSPGSPYDPLKVDLNYDGEQESGGMTKWFSNMFSNIMPKLTWGFGGTNDAFKGDPFFESVRHGRSMKNIELGAQQILTDNENKTKSLPTLSSQDKNKKSQRKGKGINLEDLFGVQLNSKQLDYTTDDAKDPGEKFRIAVEIGRRVSNPQQCSFVYNGCPLSYEEILAIINEPMRQATYVTTTTPAPPRRPVIRNGFSSTHVQRFVTIPPSIMMVPVQKHHQPIYQSYQYQPPPQQILVQSQQIPPPPQYHHIAPHPQTHLLNQQLQHQQIQAQLQYVPTIFQQHHLLPSSPTSIEDLIVNADESRNPQHTQIQHSLPSGEVLHINLKYTDKMGKPDPPEYDPDRYNSIDPAASQQDRTSLIENVSDQLSSIANQLDLNQILATSSSIENDVSEQQESFSRKVLPYPHYEFQTTEGYKVRRKNTDVKAAPSFLTSNDISVILGGRNGSVNTLGNDGLSSNSVDDVSGDALSTNKDKKGYDSDLLNPFPSSSSSLEKNSNGIVSPLQDHTAHQNNPKAISSPTPSQKLVVRKTKNTKGQNGVSARLPSPSRGSHSSVLKTIPQPSALPLNLKNANTQNPSSPSIAPQKHHHQAISKFKIKTKQVKGKGNKTRNKKNINSTKIKKSKNKRKKVNKHNVTEDDEDEHERNSSGSSSSSSNSSSSEHRKGQIPKKRVNKQQQKRKSSVLQNAKNPKRKHGKPLWPKLKQSSRPEIIEVKKRPTIPAAQAIYPVYGHRFPYIASHFHTKYPPVSSTASSFLSYFFGR